MAAKINTNDTLACTYACLMLNDAGKPVTAEAIGAACSAAGLQVRETLPILFARFLEKKPLESLLASAVATAPTEVPAAAAAGGAAAPAAAAAAKKEEKEEEDDDDMGFGLFD